MECGTTHSSVAVLPQAQLRQSAPANVSEECATTHALRRQTPEQEQDQVPPPQSQEGNAPIGRFALDLMALIPFGCSAAVEHLSWRGKPKVAGARPSSVFEPESTDFHAPGLVTLVH